MQINGKEYICHLDYGIEFIKGKWKAVVICHLNDGITRYGELYRKMEYVTHKVLSQTLDDLEKDGFVKRTAYETVPPKTEYSLTEEGYKIYTVLNALETWAKEFSVKANSEVPESEEFQNKEAKKERLMNASEKGNG